MNRSLWGHRWRKSNAQIVERSTRPISQLVKMRLPMVAPLFRKSNTKQESVLTNVGTSSLVLLERSYGPQMQFNDCIKQVVVENDISKVWREAANRPAANAGEVVRDFILTAAFAVYAEHLEQTAHHAFNRMPKRAVRTVAYAARNGDFMLARDTLSKYGVAY